MPPIGLLGPRTALPTCRQGGQPWAAAELEPTDYALRAGLTCAGSVGGRTAKAVARRSFDPNVNSKLMRRLFVRASSQAGGPRHLRDSARQCGVNSPAVHAQ